MFVCIIGALGHSANRPMANLVKNGKKMAKIGLFGILDFCPKLTLLVPIIIRFFICYFLQKIDVLRKILVVNFENRIKKYIYNDLGKFS